MEMHFAEGCSLEKSLDLKIPVSKSNDIPHISLIFNILHLHNSLIMRTFAPRKNNKKIGVNGIGFILYQKEETLERWHGVHFCESYIQQNFGRSCNGKKCDALPLGGN